MKTTFIALPLLHKTYAYQILRLSSESPWRRQTLPPFPHLHGLFFLFLSFHLYNFHIRNMYKWQVSSKRDEEVVHRLENKMRERADTVPHQVMKTWHLTVTAVTFAYYSRVSYSINRCRAAGWSQTDLI